MKIDNVFARIHMELNKDIALQTMTSKSANTVVSMPIACNVESILFIYNLF